MNVAALSRGSDSLLTNTSRALSSCNVLMVTAYSDDYTIGSLCEKVNRCYAEKHSYEFLSEVLPLSAMSEAIAPKKHCTWYKIALLKKLFADVSYLESKQIQYIMWIDADAIVVDHSTRLTDIIDRCGGRDLIIAEDMNAGCLINAGVFMLRTTRWSRSFINDVWDCVKYDDVTYYEQSAIIRVLRSNKEDLDSVSPFHSYLPHAVQGIKLFPHTAVLPLAEFNSNKGVLCNDVRSFEEYMRGLTGEEQRNLSVCASQVAGDGLGSQMRRTTSKKLTVPNLCYQATGNFCTLCQRTVGTNRKCVAAAAADFNPSLFVFHPAGMPDKLNLLYTALHKYKVPYDLAGDISHEARSERENCTPAPLRLVRGKMGQIPQADQSHLLSKMHQLS